MILDAMTDRQRTAINHPCASATDSIHDRYGRTLSIRGRLVYSLVTVNK